MNALGSLIAPLFVPANRPERFGKAAASGADAVILDLEDAVAADAKDVARDNLRALALDVPVIVRINGVDTPWHAEDCAALEGMTLAAVILPKAERVDDLARISVVAPVLALVETARGLAQARALAQSGYAARLAFGSVDYAADLGCDHEWETLYAARAELVLASRLGNLPAPLDGVTTDVTAPDSAARDARAARSLGFGGKLLIHPVQVQPVFDAFLPSAQEMEWARTVLSSGDGAVNVNGAMVDEPVRIRARAILARGIARP
ncbi:HpcH/HpaI aldolase/citrate lyase family protein [Sphingobium subterraneum]|uniref:Citrate lyase subunit beta/citryl-CoA lyase n=1 Tax=Sphingobium subterraneum TaxID=627688 RepID=A0A841IVQ1_9SPHN|nr:CoA ester lyase [Sphingobium subterraneum]MBB6122989.1 citrate lyase subunit beta/citryl-CoA lyase [Sphingobium subterraneum]